MFFAFFLLDLVVQEMNDKKIEWFMQNANSFSLGHGFVQVALFCLCMGCIMYFHEHEPDTMAPFLRGLLTRFLNRTGTPSDRLAPPSASTSQNDHSGRGSTQSSRPPGSPSADGASQAPKEPQKTPERLTIEAFQGL
jgi:hypothetical protein